MAMPNTLSGVRAALNRDNAKALSQAEKQRLEKAQSDMEAAMKTAAEAVTALGRKPSSRAAAKPKYDADVAAIYQTRDTAVKALQTADYVRLLQRKERRALLLAKQQELQGQEQQQQQQQQQPAGQQLLEQRAIDELMAEEQNEEEDDDAALAGELGLVMGGADTAGARATAGQGQQQQQQQQTRARGGTAPRRPPAPAPRPGGRPAIWEADDDDVQLTAMVDIEQEAAQQRLRNRHPTAGTAPANHEPLWKRLQLVLGAPAAGGGAVGMLAGGSDMSALAGGAGMSGAAAGGDGSFVGSMIGAWAGEQTACETLARLPLLQQIFSAVGGRVPMKDAQSFMSHVLKQIAMLDSSTARIKTLLEGTTGTRRTELQDLLLAVNEQLVEAMHFRDLLPHLQAQAGDHATLMYMLQHFTPTDRSTLLSQAKQRLARAQVSAAKAGQQQQLDEEAADDERRAKRQRVIPPAFEAVRAPMALPPPPPRPDSRVCAHCADEGHGWRNCPKFVTLPLAERVAKAQQYQAMFSGRRRD